MPTNEEKDRAVSSSSSSSVATTATSTVNEGFQNHHNPRIAAAPLATKQSDHGVSGAAYMAKYVGDWQRIGGFNGRNIGEAVAAETRLRNLKRRATNAMLSWKELEAHSKAWSSIQTSIESLTRKVGQICQKVNRLDIVLESLQKSREVRIVESWDKQKNNILRDYKARSAARVGMILKEKKEKNLRLWQSHFDEAFQRYQAGGPAPEGFRYEVALLQGGAPTGKWLPCRLDFKHANGTFDLTVAGGSAAYKVQPRWIRKGRNFQNNRREMMENSISSFKPRGLASQELDKFYEDISDDEDPNEDMKCPKLHDLKQSDPGDFVCDVCLRDFRNQIAYSCRKDDFDVCNPCYQGARVNNKIVIIIIILILLVIEYNVWGLIVVVSCGRRSSSNSSE
mmetsp:Transcript_36747/g.58907  ORF Transcript_36747/g.58907 Transcript_36747/m.58907 type:complete len:395 (-) Transcript_36747:22-1206(-)